MKKILKFLSSVTLALTMILTSSVTSFAYDSATGFAGSTTLAEEGDWKKPYSINLTDMGWLVYVVDKDENVVSDVYSLFQNATVFNKFKSAEYPEYKKVRFNGASSKPFYVYTFMEWNSFVGGGSIPMPISESESSNSAVLKQYMYDYGWDVINFLNPPVDIKTNKDNYYLIFEPLYVFPLYSSVNGVPLRFISGSTWAYSKRIIGLLGTPSYPNGVPRSEGLSESGWWWTCNYTNGNFATSICTEDEYDLSDIGITVNGEAYLSDPHVLGNILFSTMANKQYGLGIAVKHLSDTTPPTPTPKDPKEPTYTSFNGNVECKTYNYSNSYNLSNLNDPLGRIPSGEMLTNGIDVDKWFVDYRLAKHNVSPIKVEVVYTYEWEEYYGDYRDYHYSYGIEDTSSYKNRTAYEEIKSYDVPDKTEIICGNETPDHIHTDACYKTKTLHDVKWKEKHTERRTNIHKSIERSTYFYTLEEYDVETFKKANITCENTGGISAFSGNTVVYNGDFKVDYVVNKGTKTKELDVQNEHIVHVPQTKYVTVHGDSMDDCDNKATRQLPTDADRFIAHNDYFAVKDGSDTYVFLSNTAFASENEVEPTTLSTYDFPNVSTEKNVSIPFSCPNDFYYTSGEYYYISMVDSTKGKQIWRNAPETHSVVSERQASIEKRIKSNFVQNEPVFVHTPVVSRIITDGSSETQLVPTKLNDLMVDYQLRLDNKYDFQFDVEKHLNLLGYSLGGAEGMYSKYISTGYGSEVKFPFDVAIVTNDGSGDKFTYYKENTWIRVDYDAVTTYYIPSWAKETKYGEIYFRVFAYNFDDLPESTRNAYYNNIDAEDIVNNIRSDEDTKNQHYIAYTKIAVQLSGYIYGLEVVGCNDSVIFFPDESYNASNGTFNNHTAQFAKNYQEFKSGTKNRLGGDSVKYTNTNDYMGREIHKLALPSWNPKYTLPFANGSGFNDFAGTLGKGTKLGFTINTLSNMWNSSDKVVITPKWRYVDRSGNVDDDVIIYYSKSSSFEDMWIKQNDARDVFDNIDGLGTLLYDSYFVGTYTDEEINNTAKIYSNIHGMNTNSHNVYKATQVLNTNGGKGVPCFSFGKIEITEPLKTFVGNEEWLSYNLSKDGGNIVRLDDNRLNNLTSSYQTIKDSVTNKEIAKNTPELFEASLQKWYGEYYLPSNIYIVKKSDLATYGCDDLWEYIDYKDSIGTDDEIFVDDGFLVLTFDITTTRDGEEDLTYYKNQNMLLTEDAKNAKHETVEVGIDSTPITLRDGDVAIFDMRHDVNSYIAVGIGWSN